MSTFGSLLRAMATSFAAETPPTGSGDAYVHFDSALGGGKGLHHGFGFEYVSREISGSAGSFTRCDWKANLVLYVRPETISMTEYSALISDELKVIQAWFEKNAGTDFGVAGVQYVLPPSEEEVGAPDRVDGRLSVPFRAQTEET